MGSNLVEFWDEQDWGQVSKVDACFQCGIQSVMIFCKAFLECSTGRWADTSVIVQPQLVTGTSERKQNKTSQRMPHSVS